MQTEEATKQETTFEVAYKNGHSTITATYEGVRTVFPVVVYSEKLMNKVHQVQQRLINASVPEDSSE